MMAVSLGEERPRGGIALVRDFQLVTIESTGSLEI